ncbi:MAG TPA: TonB-dependent receptor [Polyangiaceae bacterium]
MTRRRDRARLRGIASLLLVASAARAEETNTPTPPAVVVVHGEATGTGPRDQTVASTVVAGEELRSPGASAAEVLARVPGVEVSRTGSSSDLSTAAIRGATSAETPVYLAGVRLNDDVTGTADLSTLPLFLMDRMEVYRGNAPVDADRLGIGGAIFFEPRFPKSSELGAGAGAGSFGARALWASGGVAGDHASALVALRREGADQDFSFKDDAGVIRRRENADYAATDAWSIARYELGRGARITTILNGYDREQGSPGLAATQNPLARTRSRRLLGAASVRLPCGHDHSGAESCALEFVTSALDASTVLTDSLALLESASLVATASNRIEEQARMTLNPGEAFTLGASVDVAHDRIAVVRPQVATEPANRTTTRPAVNATWHATADADVAFVGSLECHATEAANTTGTGACDVPELGGRLGANLRLSRALSLRANAGHYGRVPTLGELYGVSAVVRGNPNLGAETGNTIDLGVHVRTRSRRTRTDFDLFGFARTVEDLVAYRQSVLGVVVPFNVGRARVLGVEMAGASEAFGWLGNTITMTLLDARDTTPDRAIRNDILPFRSRLVFSDYTEIYADPGLRALRLDRAAVGFRVTHRSSRYADSAGLIVIPDQMTMDLEASAMFLKRTLGARVAFRNIANAREVDTVGMPLPGRNVHAAVEGWWR